MNFALLEIAIGLVLIYTLLSLLCSTINEGISSFFAVRANTLQGALKNLLGKDLAASVYDHHLVQGLVQREKILKLKRWQKPSYIPTKTFVMTVLDAVGGAGAALGQPGFPKSVDELRAAVAKIPDAGARQAIMALIADAEGDLDKLKVNLGAWFDGSLERVSGWYRRKVKLIILAIGIVISFGFGVDSISLGHTLHTNGILRAALVEAAEKRVRDANVNAANPDAATTNVREAMAAVRTDLDSLSIPRFPFFKQGEEFRKATGKQAGSAGFLEVLWYWLSRHFVGCFLTSAALSLGAPFWFDLLNKLVSIRSVGKRPEQGTEPAKV